MRKNVKKTHNHGTMTKAGFKTMIISALRDKSRWWKPKQECLKRARVSKGVYKCAICSKKVNATKIGTYVSGKKKGLPKKIKNIVVDHIEPVIDPKVGFVDWDTYIARMFVEVEGLQAICDDCHSIKTAEERAIAKERK